MRSLVLLSLALSLCLLTTGCATATTSRPGVGGSAPLYTPGATGARAKAAPSAATITIIHIRPEARDYVHP